MSLRCKKGDMAWDLGHNPRHNGRICTVGEFKGDVKSDKGLPVPNAWEITFNDDKPEEKWIESDSRLLPIRPGDLQETEETEKEIEHV